MPKGYQKQAFDIGYMHGPYKVTSGPKQNDDGKKARWYQEAECTCCGKKKNLLMTFLQTGSNASCLCKKYERHAKLAPDAKFKLGDRYSDDFVISSNLYTIKTKSGDYDYYKIKCTCGKVLTKSAEALTLGLDVFCGCDKNLKCDRSNGVFASPSIDVSQLGALNAKRERTKENLRWYYELKQRVKEDEERRERLKKNAGISLKRGSYDYNQLHQSR
jgi:hypothetical protein